MNFTSYHQEENAYSSIFYAFVGVGATSEKQRRDQKSRDLRRAAQREVKKPQRLKGAEAQSQKPAEFRAERKKKANISEAPAGSATKEYRERMSAWCAW